MKEQFVTYEIAERLKELGFNDPCLKVFRHGEFTDSFSEGVMQEIYAKPESNVIRCPLWQQVIDWLREKHGVDVVYNPVIMAYEVRVYPHDVSHVFIITDKAQHSQAREAAILKALELITL